MQFNHQVRPRSLYLHWPFCPYKCHFCPFVAIASQDQFMQQYHRALIKEIELFTQHYDQKIPLDTIYMGGGTPSTYPDDLLLDMFGTLVSKFEITGTTEVTIEVNPGTVRDEQLLVWKQLGINRLSIGVQSLKDPVLKKLNRHQSAADVYAVINSAKDIFDNISVDLILGLPEVSDEEWKELLQIVVTLPIAHLSIYFLTIHEDTPLYFRIQKQEIALPCDDGLVDLYYWSIDFLAQHGFKQYEISSFARPGYQSRHNQVYWDRTPYMAFGLGACSFDGAIRFQNEKNLMKYIKAIEDGRIESSFFEVLTRKQIYAERVMLGIRQSRGLLIEEVMGDLLPDEQKYFKEQLAWLTTHGFVSERDGRVLLTPIGLSVENTIALRLSGSA